MTFITFNVKCIRISRVAMVWKTICFKVRKKPEKFKRSQENVEIGFKRFVFF